MPSLSVLAITNTSTATLQGALFTLADMPHLQFLASKHLARLRKTEPNSECFPFFLSVIATYVDLLMFSALIKRISE